jgi:hypothetical protein
VAVSVGAQGAGLRMVSARPAEFFYSLIFNKNSHIGRISSVAIATLAEQAGRSSPVVRLFYMTPALTSPESINLQ